MGSIWESKRWSLKHKVRLGQAPEPSEEFTQREYRTIYCNDPQANLQFKYKGNSISTTKFNMFTFLPKGLFEQFRRPANLYFLVIALLSMAPTSPIQPITNVFPLVLVLSISLSKEAFEDWKRFRNDKRINSSVVEVLQGDKWVKTVWSKLVVGNLVRIKSKEFFPADLLLLTSSNDEGVCYIETSNLDGESNLKTRRALEPTWKYIDSHQASNFAGEIHCENPNDSLYTFTGNLIVDKETFPISPEQILLRGCSLQNTNWIVGVVIFTGHETKVMMNALNVPSKRSTLDKKVDQLIYFLIGLLFTMTLVGAIGCGIFLDIQLWYLELLKDSGYIYSANSRVLVGMLMALSLITLYNTIIPVSLYVSIEVEYIFSDKTGTLTQNVMEFLKCSIGGVMYGSGISEIQRAVAFKTRLPLEELHGNRPENEFYEKGFNFYDQRLMKGAWRKEQNPKICEEFFRALAVCHTVLPDGEAAPEKITYQASSPDEIALVIAAKRLGFFFHRRTTSSIIIRESHVEQLGCTRDVEYKILNVLEFNSLRKRQSIICLHPNGQPVLYSKGADTAIYERLENSSSPIALATWSHLETFASEGLRTLCVAYRFIDFDTYNSWNEKFKEAKSSLIDREEKLNQVAELIEQNLILLGCVAIEDKLQDGVPMCIHSLLAAGIKIWVLTGDKLETAINVGYACGLIDNDIRKVVISSDTKGNVADAEMKNRVKQQLIFSLEDIGQHKQVKSNNMTLVIDGKCLTYALELDIHDIFLELSCQCFTVICCRVTPLQKAQVTTLIRYKAKKITLSIGDGANDVSMIQAAHIGIAIRGQEGMQAVMASDFTISQFRFLTELLLVHGRLSYIRISRVVTYFFYKNMALTMTQFWFIFFCGYSAQNFYDDWYQSLYNVFFTALPVFAIGIFDQDVSAEVSKQFPQLYKAGITNLYFRWPLLARWLLSSIVQSFVIFYFSVLTGMSGKDHDGKILGLWDVGTLGFSCVIITVSLRVIIGSNFLTVWHHLSIFGSILIWFLFLFLYTSIYSIWDAQENVYGQILVLLSTLNFWLILLFVPVAALSVDFVFEGFQRRYAPYDYQIIQEREHCRSKDVPERKEQKSSVDLGTWLLQPS